MSYRHEEPPAKPIRLNVPRGPAEARRQQENLFLFECWASLGRG